MHRTRLDAIVVGAGMAGASVAAELSKRLRVVLIERESQPGVHSTGRSAASFIPSYKADIDALRILTKVSEFFFRQPPVGFTDFPLLKPRGLLTLLREASGESSEPSRKRLNDLLGGGIEFLDAHEVTKKLPAISDEWAGGAWWEKNVHDIDVHGLHHGYFRMLKANGGVVCHDSDAHPQRSGGLWEVCVEQHEYSAPLIVNAAGAWADEFAERAGVAPVGLQPKRRTAVLVKPPAESTTEDWPLVLAHDESFYLKPDAGLLLVSPADEHPTGPCDARPEELDIAIACDRACRALKGLNIQRVDHAWAGLRTFVGDGLPVIGLDDEAPGFFWCVGQGGHGIQIAPAVAQLSASIILDDAVPIKLEELGFHADWVSPARLRKESRI